MPNLIKVKPREGLNVAGFPCEKETQRTPQVIRLLKDGDLIEVKGAKKKTPKKKVTEIE